MPTNPYMSGFEMNQWATGGYSLIGDYKIAPKKDFGSGGFYDAATRANINAGWIITKDGFLATPGGAWFKTNKEATVGVHLLIAAKGDPDVYNALSAAMYAMAEATTHNKNVAAAHSYDTYHVENEPLMDTKSPQ